MSDAVKAEMAKIRAEYPWLEEATIERYAEQIVKKRNSNEYNRDKDEGA